MIRPMPKPDAGAPEYCWFRETSSDGKHAVGGWCHPSLWPHIRLFTGDVPADLKPWVFRVFSERPNWVAAVDLPFDSLPFKKMAVKRFRPRTPFHRWLEPVLARPRPTVSLETALRYKAAGVSTPDLVLALERRRHGWVTDACTVTALVPDAQKVRHLLREPSDDPQDTERFLDRVADTVRRLHDAGIMHRDLTLGNFLWTRESPDTVWLIDLGRSIRPPFFPWLLRLVDLSRMNLGPRWPDFYRRYCRGDERLFRRLGWLRVLVRWRRASIAMKKAIR